MAFINELGNGISRTIDYEQNAILSNLRGSTVGLYDFQLLWNDARIEFGATAKKKYLNGPTPISIEWKIDSFKIPEYLNERKLEVLNLIKDGLMVFGNYGVPDWKGTVSVTMNPALENGSR